MINITEAATTETRKERDEKLAKRKELFTKFALREVDKMFESQEVVNQLKDEIEDLCLGEEEINRRKEAIKNIEGTNNTRKENLIDMIRGLF